MKINRFVLALTLASIPSAFGEDCVNAAKRAALATIAVNNIPYFSDLKKPIDIKDLFIESITTALAPEKLNEENRLHTYQIKVGKYPIQDYYHATYTVQMKERIWNEQNSSCFVHAVIYQSASGY